MTKLFSKAIKVFESNYKNQGLEMRSIFLMDWRGKNEGNFKIECNLVALNKYYSVMVYVNEKDKKYKVSELIEEK